MRIFLLLCVAAIAGGGIEPLLGHDDNIIRPVRGTLLEESFVHGIIRSHLEQIGYQVNPESVREYDSLQHSIGAGEFDYTASIWAPLHTNEKFEDVELFGPYTFGMIGIYVDKESAAKFNLKSLADITPDVVHYFGHRIAGKSSAKIIGCPESFGCENWLHKQFEPYDLNRFITSKSGCYTDNVINGLNDYLRGKPLLMVAWQPFWFFNVINRDDDVVALYEEPLSLYIAANRNWISRNQKIAQYFDELQIHVSDIARQNYLMRQGQSSHYDIRKHVLQYFGKPVG